MRFVCFGLVHDVDRIFDVESYARPVDDTPAYIASLIGELPMNLVFKCGGRAMWFAGFDDVALTQEPVTCLTCIAASK